MVQVPLARIIELINNVAQRGMAVIKEPRLCVLRFCGLLHRSVWGWVKGGGTADTGTHSGMQLIDS